MAQKKVFHCIVDETAITTGLTEIEQWVQRGVVTLVIPLHSNTAPQMQNLVNSYSA